MALPVLPTTVVGSYPQPDWLVNREMLSKTVPRTRMKELWRVEERFLEQAQDDATALAIRDMEEVIPIWVNPGDEFRDMTITPVRDFSNYRLFRENSYKVYSGCVKGPSPSHVYYSAASARGARRSQFAAGCDIWGPC